MSKSTETGLYLLAAAVAAYALWKLRERMEEQRRAAIPYGGHGYLSKYVLPVSQGGVL